VCRQEHSLDAEQLPEGLILSGVQSVFRATGCRECGYSGYSGRIAIFELLLNNGRIRSLCNERSSSSEIRAVAVASGMQTLREMAWQRVLAGETSLEELVRVCPVENE
jgi:general secretion pathway protein E/type IV pilus assembly protein PilB